MQMKEPSLADPEQSDVSHRANVDQENESLINEGPSQKHKTPQEELNEKKKKLEEWLEYLKEKLFALLWVCAACAAIYYSNFFKHFYNNEKTNKFFYNIFMLSVGVNAIVAIYVAIVMPYFLKIKEDVETYNPRVIYIASISGFISFFSLIITVWPIFGWYSVPLVFLMFIGYINTNHFLPNNSIGSLLFCLIFLGAFFTHLIIEHEGYLH